MRAAIHEKEYSIVKYVLVMVVTLCTKFTTDPTVKDCIDIIETKTKGVFV